MPISALNLRSVAEPHDMHTSPVLTEACWFATCGSFQLKDSQGRYLMLLYIVCLVEIKRKDPVTAVTTSCEVPKGSDLRRWIFLRSKERALSEEPAWGRGLVNLWEVLFR